MRYLKYLALLGIFLFAAGYSQAQVSVGIGVGPVYGGYVEAPACSYGYYDSYPYDCAPYGYWGPAYFVGGEFIGVGPWYRGHFDRDRYWGDRGRFEQERGFAGDRGRGNFRSFDRGNGNRGGGYQSFSRGNGNRGGNYQSFSRGNGNRGGNYQSFSRGNGNRGGNYQSLSRGNSGGGNSFRGSSGRSSGGSFRGGSSRGGGGSRGGSNRGGGSHGGGHGRH